MSHLHNKLHTELKHYLHFLLQFANQNEKFKKSHVYTVLQLNKILVPIAKKPLIRI